MAVTILETAQSYGSVQLALEALPEIFDQNYTIETDEATVSPMDFTIDTKDTSGFRLLITTQNQLCELTVPADTRAVYAISPNWNDITIEGITFNLTSSSGTRAIRLSGSGGFEFRGCIFNFDNVADHIEAFSLVGTRTLGFTSCVFNLDASSNPTQTFELIDISNTTNSFFDKCTFDITGINLGVTAKLIDGLNNSGSDSTLTVIDCSGTFEGSTFFRYRGGYQFVTIERNNFTLNTSSSAFSISDNGGENNENFIFRNNIMAASAGRIINVNNTCTSTFQCTFNTFVYPSGSISTGNFADVLGNVINLGNINYIDLDSGSFQAISFRIDGLTLANINTRLISDYNVYHTTTTPNNSFLVGVGNENGSAVLGDSGYQVSEFGEMQNDGIEINSTQIDPDFNDYLNGDYTLSPTSQVKNYYDDLTTNYSNRSDVRGFTRQEFFVALGGHDPDALDGAIPSNDIIVPKRIAVRYSNGVNAPIDTEYVSSLQLAWLRIRNNSYMDLNHIVGGLNGFFVVNAGTDPILPGFYPTTSTFVKKLIHTTNPNVHCVKTDVGNWLIFDETDTTGDNYYLSVETPDDINEINQWDFYQNGVLIEANVSFSVTRARDYDHEWRANHTDFVGALWMTSAENNKGIFTIGLDNLDNEGNAFPVNSRLNMKAITGNNSAYGIWMASGKNLVVENADISGRGFGIRVGPETGAGGLSLLNCDIYDSRYGISCESSDGTAIRNCKVINSDIPLNLSATSNIFVEGLEFLWESTERSQAQPNEQAYIQGIVSDINNIITIRNSNNIVLEGIISDVAQYIGTYDFSGMDEHIKAQETNNLDIYNSRFVGGFGRPQVYYTLGITQSINNSNIAYNYFGETGTGGLHTTNHVQVDGGSNINLTNNYFKNEYGGDGSLSHRFSCMKFRLNTQELEIANNYFRVENSGTANFATGTNLTSFISIEDQDGPNDYIIKNNAFESGINMRWLLSLDSISDISVNGVSTLRTKEEIPNYDSSGATQTQLDNDLNLNSDYNTNSVYLFAPNSSIFNDADETLAPPAINITGGTVEAVLQNAGDASFNTYAPSLDIINNVIDPINYDIGPISSSGVPYVPVAGTIDPAITLDQDVSSTLDQAPFNQIFPANTLNPSISRIEHKNNPIIIPEQEDFTIKTNVQGEYSYIVTSLVDSNTGAVLIRTLGKELKVKFESNTLSDKKIVRTFDLVSNIILLDGTVNESRLSNFITVVQPRPVASFRLNRSFVFASETGENDITLTSTSSYADELEWTYQDNNGITQVITNTSDISSIGPFIYDNEGRRDVSLMVTNTTSSDTFNAPQVIKALPDPVDPVIEFRVEKFSVDLNTRVGLKSFSKFVVGDPLIQWRITKTDDPTYTHVGPILTGAEAFFTPTELGEYDVMMEMYDPNDESRSLKKKIRRAFTAVPAIDLNTAIIVDNSLEPLQTRDYATPSDIGNAGPGDVILLRGGQYNQLYFDGFVGTAENPIRISNYPGERVLVDRFDTPTQFTNGVSLINCEHVYLVGEIFENTTSNVEASYLNWEIITQEEFAPNSLESYFGLIFRNYIFAGVHIHQASTDITVIGTETQRTNFAGIMAKEDPNPNRPQFWDEFFRMYNIKIGRNLIDYAHGEAMYLGYSAYYMKGDIANATTSYNVTVKRNISPTLATLPGGYSKGDTVTVNTIEGEATYGMPHALINCKVFHNKMYNSGWDGFQLGNGCSGAEIHDNYIEAAGTENVFGQDAGVSLNLVCGDFYNNRLNNTKSINGSITGDFRIFNNAMTNVVTSTRGAYLFYKNIEAIKFNAFVNGLSDPEVDSYNSIYRASYADDPDIEARHLNPSLKLFHNTILGDNDLTYINSNGINMSATMEDLFIFNNLTQINEDNIVLDRNNVPSGVSRVIFYQGDKSPGDPDDSSGHPNDFSNTNYTNVLVNDVNYATLQWELYENLWIKRTDVSQVSEFNPDFANYIIGDITILPTSPIANMAVVDAPTKLGENNNELLKFDRNGLFRSTPTVGASEITQYSPIIQTIPVPDVPDVIKPPFKMKTVLDGLFPTTTPEINNGIVKYRIFSETSNQWLTGTVKAVADIDPNTDPTGNGENVNPNSIVILDNGERKNTPSGPLYPGRKGDVTYDEQFIYYCIQDNLWIRTFISGFGFSLTDDYDRFPYNAVTNRDFGAIPQGTNIGGMTVSDIITLATNTTLNSGFKNLKSDIPTYLEVGSTLLGNHEFTFNFTEDTVLNANSIIIRDLTNDNDLLTGINSSPVTVDLGSITYSGETIHSWYATAEKSNSETIDSNPITAEWRFKRFWGTSNESDPTNNSIRTQMQDYELGYDNYISIDPNNMYVFFAYPSKYGRVSEIYVNNLYAFNDFTLITKNITNIYNITEEYNIYVTNNVNNTFMNVKFK